jgi:hypothetical protein
MRTDRDVVFTLWCRLTGQNAVEFAPEERAAFFARPQISVLSTLPYDELLDAGITAASRGSLPLERWLGSVRHESISH